MKDYVNQQRQARGFLTEEELIATVGEHNSLLVPGSTLISAGVIIGQNNLFYPNVVIERQDQGEITIGDDNVFYPGAYILGSMGKIAIGNNNEFGTAGVTIKANMPDAQIEIGNCGRYTDGAAIMGRSVLGSGSQILGNITVQNCSLEAGGDYREPDPDKRAALLKGFGLARNINLGTGQVVNGSGNFSDAPVELQRSYHPPKK